MPPTAGSSTADAHPVFYVDVGSPECYLAAERVLGLVPPPCEWVPVLLPAAPFSAGSIAARAAARGLQPFRLPEPFPFDSSFAQRAATFAKGAGKTVAFLLAALRQAYAGGRDLSAPENVMIAGAACEIHPRALVKGAGTASAARALDAAGALARERGVSSTPAVWLPDGSVFHGDAGLDRAARAVASAAS